MLFIGVRLTFWKIIPYADELISLLGLLHDKALSKRGYSWTGKLLSSLLLTMTHTYPLENKFVNADMWSSKGRLFEVTHRPHKILNIDRVPERAPPQLGHTL